MESLKLEARDQDSRRISSVSDYLAIVDNASNRDFLINGVNGGTFYRGQSDSKWELSPSLFREGLLDSENVLLTSIRRYRPDDFVGSRLQQLALLKHYGMPTRLLDVTTNPLVGLYFACGEPKDADGRVFVFPRMPTSWGSDPFISMVVDFCFDFCATKCDLDSVLHQVKAKYSVTPHHIMPDTVKRLLVHLTIPCQFVLPEWTNPRIGAQRGAFIVCGMDLLRVEPAISNVDPNKQYHFFGPASDLYGRLEKQGAFSLIVPHQYKEDILRQLEAIGIDESSLFPDLPHAIAHTVREVKARKLGPHCFS